MFHRFIHNYRRNKHACKTDSTAMQAFLNAPTQSLKTPITGAEYLVLDLEMTGLDSKKDVIVSIGFVPIRNNQIINNEARHWLIQQSDADLQQSAPIHKIRNIDLQQGRSINDALDELLIILSGKVLVAHHAPIDLSFLNQACKKIYGVPLLLDSIDTLLVEKKRLSRHGEITHNSLRLHNCRNRYNLPHYSAHNAVIDAIATAELWLCQMAHSSSGSTLNDFV